MKPLLCLTVILLFGCKHKPLAPQNTSPVDTTKQPVKTKIALPASKVERNKYHIDKDTVYIRTSYGDTIIYSREQFNDIIDNFPELYSPEVTNPDSTFASGKIWVNLIDSLGNDKTITFGSEQGQDRYYILYAWFLKNKQGIAKYAVRRKKLLDVYRTLNHIFGRLNYGGTYFGHQYARIEGYAEFAVYWYNHTPEFFERPYDISKQKTHYIEGLKQLIRDEVSIDENLFTEEDRRKRVNELFREVNHLNKLITDIFYLRMAKSFQIEKYRG
ncbi:hypothetical protein [Niastella sp. OAS944]|uniref:hypothetical protein n=1 Tax=Niastella sp. OAS944 TaxID=2664089 RepID=UPI00347D33D1|nr:hypothetical protein [Chitinophagaceae bacterium OAS944]